MWVCLWTLESLEGDDTAKISFGTKGKQGIRFQYITVRPIENVILQKMRKTFQNFSLCIIVFG